MNSSLKFWLKVTRSYQCILAGLASWITALLCDGSVWFSKQNIAAFAMSTFGCLGAFLMHYAIRHTAYEKKWRHVPHQSRPYLFLRLGVYSLAGFSMTIAGLFLPLTCLVIAMVNFLALYIYATVVRSWPWKNLVASFLCITPILIGWLAVQQTHPVVPFLLVSAFCVYMAREILKDIEDIDIDHGERFTLVMKLGKHPSMRIASIFLLAGILFYAIASLHLSLHSPLVIGPLLFGGLLFFFLALRLLFASEGAFNHYRIIDAAVALLMLALLAVRAGF